MSASPFDSALYRDLFTDKDTATLFTDTAEIRAMLLAWGALALAQAKHGLIPETAAHAIQRAAMEIQVDPAALTAQTGINGVPIPALSAAFQAEMKAPEHSAFVHFGATSQDIMDTGLSLRLRQVLGLFEARLRTTTKTLGALAKTHAHTPMAGRTWGQIATPTSFGAILASWGQPLLDLSQDIAMLRDTTLPASLSGAAGTLATMSPHGAAIRADFARGLGLTDPGHSWHSTRHPRTRLAAWMTQVTAALGKMGEDLTLLTSSAQQEVQLSQSGASSTMPQKQNPVQAQVLVTLAQHCGTLNSGLQAASQHREQRDGAAWMAEWLTLPQLCCAAGRALALAEDLVRHITPDTARMADALDDGRGLIFAEALTFELAKTLPKPDAQALVKALCAQVIAEGGTLPRRAMAAHPGLDLAAAFTPNLGTAPDDALAFAQAAGA